MTSAAKSRLLNNINNVEEIFLYFTDIDFNDLRAFQFVFVFTKNSVLKVLNATKKPQRKFSISAIDIFRRIKPFTKLKKIMVCEKQGKESLKSSNSEDSSSSSLYKLLNTSRPVKEWLENQKISFSLISLISDDLSNSNDLDNWNHSDHLDLIKIIDYLDLEIANYLKTLDKNLESDQIIKLLSQLEINISNLSKIENESKISNDLNESVDLSNSLINEKNQLLEFPEIFDQKIRIQSKLDRSKDLVDEIIQLNVIERGDLVQLPSLLEFYNFLKNQYVSLEENIGKRLDENKVELLSNLNNLELSVNEIEKVLKENFEKKQSKQGKKKELRLPIPYNHFKLIYHNAGLSFVRQPVLRQSQLRVIYCLLYFLGLRLGELKCLTIEDLEEGLKTGELNLVLSKTNTPIIRVLPTQGLNLLQSLKKEIDFIFKDCGLKYLGSLKANNEEIPDKSNFVAFINDDLYYISTHIGIPVYTSHSFRVTYITNLLKTQPVHNVSKIVGHKDWNSTLLYNRYMVNSTEIKDILNNSFEKSMKL
jgi:integrase